MGYVKSRGIILQSFDSKEKDRVSVVLTDNLGKINVKFKSVKSSLSKRSGYTDDLTMLEMMIYKHLNSFTATDVEVISSFTNAKSNISNYNALLYLKELPTIFLENGQKDVLLFELVEETLIALDHGYNPPLTLLQFIFKFLTIAGLQINFGVEDMETIYFSPEEGGFNNNKGLPIRRDIYVEMRRISESDSYRTVNDSLFGEILNLLNLYISYHAESKHFADFIENLQKINAG